uniref:Uncharacterized protein n=1 Tax=Timema douglasi TaxID=61478 RepID=A0A7R8VKC1_TIMDO|nr:unnamed protein product [Timema douglasi]
MGSVRKLEALSPRQRSRGQIARSRRQQQQQCELPESYKYLHQRSNAPATITSSYENVMQAQTSSRTSTSYPDLMQRHVDGDGMPHYLKSNYHPIPPTVSGNSSCYHPHQQYQQQPLRRSFGHPGSIQATMRDPYINHHSNTNHNEMQWTSSYYGNTSTSQGANDGLKVKALSAWTPLWKLAELHALPTPANTTRKECQQE